jgi:stage V sporulation protein R
LRKISKAFNNEWNLELLSEIYETIHGIAVDELKYDIYPNQIEILTSTGMLEAYASVGLPIMYRHWSFGKKFLMHSREYSEGVSGLAYEIVINSNPCITYLMEGNTLTMQALTIAHACFGHNMFFKNNYLFRQWTHPEFILNYLIFAKKYLTKCEEKYGMGAVEEVLDAAHALRNYCVDKYKLPKKSNMQKETEELRRIAWKDSQYNDLFNAFETPLEIKTLEDKVDETEETENILYFIEKNSKLPEWKKEIVRIVRKIGQYFYPQMQTQVTNEGFATSTHHLLLHKMEERGLVDEAFMLEFMHNHSSVIFQPSVKDKRFNGINPYALGFEIYQDIRRRCENPTKEDEKYFPYQVGRPFLDVWFEAVEGYKNESFIEQYLSPTTVRKMKFMTLFDKSISPNLEVVGNADDNSFIKIREALSRQYDLGLGMPQIAVQDVRKKTDNTLILRYTMNNGVPLYKKGALKVVDHIKTLWEFPVELIEYNSISKNSENLVRVS